MSSEEEEEEELTLEEIQSSAPHWAPLASALQGRYERITAEDVWRALHQFHGQVAKASNFLSVLSDERSLSPEARAVRDALKRKREQLEWAKRDLKKAEDKGKAGEVIVLKEIVDKLTEVILRLQGPRRVKVLVIDDQEQRRNEVHSVLEWLTYEVTIIIIIIVIITVIITTTTTTTIGYTF